MHDDINELSFAIILSELLRAMAVLNQQEEYAAIPMHWHNFTCWHPAFLRSDPLTRVVHPFSMSWELFRSSYTFRRVFDQLSVSATQLIVLPQ